MPTVDLRGVPSHHEITGSGEPLLLLHGGFCSLETMRPLGELLSTSYEVHAVERPGHGRTPDREGPITYADGVLDTLAYLDAVGLDRVHVVGFSDGAIIGLLLAIDHPERVRSLVAISANTDPSGYLADGSHGADERPEAADGADPERAAYDALSPDGPGHADEVLAKLGRMWTTEPDIAPAALATISAPTLVLAGDRDVIARDHTLGIADAVPGARLAVLPGSHMLVAERPTVVGFTVLDFLARIGSGPAQRGFAVTFSTMSTAEAPDPPDWVDGVPTRANGQHCAFCGAAATWVHPLDRELSSYRDGGRGYTLGRSWSTCDACEAGYRHRDDETLVARMMAGREPGTDADHEARRPLAAFRRADLGARRYDPPHPELARLREAGFEALHDHTGATEEIAAAWPAEHVVELGPDVEPDPDLRWFVRSPDPGLRVRQVVDATVARLFG